jgi:hypothetical protein
MPLHAVPHDPAADEQVEGEIVDPALPPAPNRSRTGRAPRRSSRSRPRRPVSSPARAAGCRRRRSGRG